MDVQSVKDIRKAITAAEQNGENLYVLLPKRFEDSFMKLVLDARKGESNIEVETVNGWLSIDVNKVIFFAQ